MDWRVDVLRTLDAPTTDANLQFLSDWQRAEGGHTANSARWNYLNTTMGVQYPSINSVGVRSFPDYQTGIRMTAGTIRNGRYPNLLEGLRRGNPYTGPVASDLSTWVSGSPTKGLAYAQKILGGIGSGIGAGVGSAGQAGNQAAAGCGTILVLVAFASALAHFWPA